MKRLLSDSVLPFVNQGRINMHKVNMLIELKEFVDRVATKGYIGEKTVASLLDRFGVEPEVITWGDYFQSELVFDSVRYSDEELRRVVDTIKFDIMSAYQVFCDHSSNFFEWVEKSSNEIILNSTSAYTEEEQEILHLKILKDYYCNMALVDRFSPEEVLWYAGFKEDEEENAEVS
ncbi:MAG: hypothetical protein PF637_13985 [Spirochaetes bacterium]|nr:hypothetical protein [Spirochaetota bacterium]